MRAIHSGGLAALDSGRFNVRCLLKAEVEGDPICIWDDVGDIIVAGDTYHGAASRFTVSGVVSELGVSVPKMDVTLSGLDNTVLSMIDGEVWHERSITVQRMISAIDTPQVLHLVPEFSGYMDQMTLAEASGSTSDITIACESSSREMARSYPVTRSDVDQRTRDPDDPFLAHAYAAISRELNWGGRKQNPPKPTGIARILGKLF